MNTHTYISELITRLARLDASASWAGDLNPTQKAALGYLSRANRFSRSPSHLSDYLGTTRGTVSQSLKSLLQKGYVEEHRSEQDKRVVSYELTAKGEKVALDPTPLEVALRRLGADETASLQSVLTDVLRQILKQKDGPEFGPCQTCIHHKMRPDGARCLLLDVGLTDLERTQICFEQESV